MHCANRGLEIQILGVFWFKKKNRKKQIWKIFRYFPTYYADQQVDPDAAAAAPPTKHLQLDMTALQSGVEAAFTNAGLRAGQLELPWATLTALAPLTGFRSQEIKLDYLQFTSSIPKYFNLIITRQSSVWINELFSELFFVSRINCTQAQYVSLVVKRFLFPKALRQPKTPETV